MPGPIKPDDVVKKKTAQIPEFVFEVANELIAEKWNGSSATFRLDEFVKRVLDRAEKHPSTKGATRDTIRADLFEKHAFDIEDSYRVEGWKVDFDKPGYCETYPATFTFKKRRKGDD